MQTLAHIGQLLSGIGVLITTLVALCTLFIFHKKQLDDAWLDRFRNLYQEFWNDEGMIEARHLINNSEGYAELEKILKKRNMTPDCNVNWEEYKILERIDNFCSVLTRVRSFGLSIRMSDIQKELWEDLLYSLWIKKFEEKTELREYVKRHWPKLMQAVEITKRKKFILF
jgi:hypothetical protein